VTFAFFAPCTNILTYLLTYKQFDCSLPGFNTHSKATIYNVNVLSKLGWQLGSKKRFLNSVNATPQLSEMVAMSQYINRHNRYISQSPVHVQYMMAIKPDISTHNSSATIQDEIRWFLPARGHARAVLAVIVSVCPSVCPSFTSVCSTKTAKPRITQTTPYDSTKTLGKFLLPKISAKFQRGNPQRGRQFTKLRWRYIRSGN